MEDEKIVQLYWDRNERAIAETSKKYEPYCISIAFNILNDRADSEECVNDTWLKAWNAMPPSRPSMLSTFLGKITRNLAFDRFKLLTRDKRGGYGMDVVLDELGECVSGRDEPEQVWQEKELSLEINRFLKGLAEDRRAMFILRYWYAESITDIAARMELTENNVSVTLSRIRGKLREHLTERGFNI
ncbi:MAG: RNA polymerase sigma factor [Firmicutes bacterium]|nr:RNA polymerase sigma factor [Bacillota bacterium]